MSELLRNTDTIHEALLDLQRQEAVTEWQEACALMGLPWGEQPDSPALPADGALRGEAPLSNGGAVDKEIK